MGEFLKNIRGDLRNTVVSVIATALILGPVGTALWKAVREQPIPWSILLIIAALGIFLLFFQLRKGTGDASAVAANRTNPSKVIHHSVSMAPSEERLVKAMHAATDRAKARYAKTAQTPSENTLSGSPPESISKEQCLYATVESLKTPTTNRKVIFNHLYRAKAYLLPSNRDLEWVREQLVEHKHQDPFTDLEECVFPEERRAFLIWGHLHGKWDFWQPSDYLHAALEWKEMRGRKEPETRVRRGVMANIFEQYRDTPT